MGERFPRELSGLERDLLLWMLPSERPGYNEYRTLVQKWKILAPGRRGEGNYILGPAGERADNESPLPQILAYGIVESTTASLSVTLRERLENQLEFEIQSIRGRFDPEQFLETRRWNYSSWLPGMTCPNCGGTLREIPMTSGRGQSFVLAVCIYDQRIWVHDNQSGVNHLIPVSNFYNELMLHKNIREPKIALDAKNLFRDSKKYSDADLKHAFRTYNRVRSKIPLESEIVVEDPRQSILDRIGSWLFRRT